MRAAWYDRQGRGAEVLQVGEVPEPEPGRGRGAGPPDPAGRIPRCVFLLRGVDAYDVQRFLKSIHRQTSVPEARGWNLAMGAHP